MDPIIWTVVTESGARVTATEGVIEVLGGTGKKLAPIDNSLLCELVNVNGKWELVVNIEYPKTE